MQAAALCSLPSGMRFTLLLRQNAISPKLAVVLQAATVRGNPLLRAGELRDLYGAQAILCDSGFGEETWATSSIRVPCIPIGERLPVLNNEQQQRISEDLQAKLLAFRFSSYQAACATGFDSSKFAMLLQELSMSLAAATPGDVELQGELRTLLQEENASIEAANWVDSNTVIIEAILAHCREAKMESVYVGAIAEMAGKILEGRGESRRLDPGEVGRRIKSLGFRTEPRDARGMKLLLTNAVCVRTHELAHQFKVCQEPPGDNPRPVSGVKRLIMKKLTHYEREKEHELQRRIRAAGIPIVVEPPKDEVPELLIRQGFEAYESTVFDAADGGTGLILPLKIVPNISVFVSSGFDVSLARWPNVWFRLLEENYGGEWPHYSFYGRSELKFDRSETINRFIADQKTVRRGHPVQGLLLACSYDPMPNDIVRGEVLRGSIKILDQFERSHAGDISLRAHRETARRLQPNPERPRLLACPDSKSSRVNWKSGTNI